MKKRRIMATSSIAVALFLSSYASAQGANYAFARSTYSQIQNVTVARGKQEDISVSANDFKEDLGMDPTFEASLVEQGFSPSQIQKIFTSASLKNDYTKLPLGE